MLPIPCPQSSLRAAVAVSVQILCACAAATVCITASARAISVTSATYGANCGAPRGNATFDLRGQCNGLTDCPYVAGKRVAPQPSACKADLEAEWKCAENEVHVATVRHVGSDSTLAISCVEQNGPGH